ncbi:alpha/beta hydrolase family protein [Plantactinospora sp. CA-294935]|uniref:alpha/beta hydrolase family protein n=1 Tax=Plantactinospora sp. CA-294935 TaxID=3240012 RepID=UPI003D94F9B7
MPPLKGGPARSLLCLLAVLAFLVGAVNAAGPVAASTGASDVDDFYQYPSQEMLARTSPGEILASEPMTVSSDLQNASSQAVRIMYRSIGLHGSPIAVTGFLLLPRGDTPPGGWPVTAWGHGTTGVGPVCAPSRLANLYPYSDQYAETDAIVRLLQDGYAVVGTDYPGLGFPDTLANFPQADLESRAVIDSVLAAHQLSPHLARQWFAVGHSQGAAAVLRVGQNAARWAPGLLFLGTVALAPPSHFNEILDDMAAAQPPVNPGLAALGAYVAVGAHLYSPRIRYTDVLVPELAAQIPVVKRLCENELTIYLTNVQLNGIVNPDWASNPTLRRFVDTLEPATDRSTRPVLLLQGGQDQTVPAATTTALNTQLCGFGDVVDYRVYPDADHESVLSAADKDMAAWMRDRLQGHQAPSTCPPVQPAT